MQLLDLPAAGDAMAYYGRPGDPDPRTRRTDAYSWGDKTLAFRRCANCGCITHWEPIERRVADRMV